MIKKQSKISNIIISAIVVGMVAFSAMAEKPPRYTDKLNGFSLQPIENATRTQPDPSQYLARWLMYEEKTGNIVWSFSVHKSVSALIASEDIDNYKMSLTKEITGQEGATITTTDQTSISGRPALIFTGMRKLPQAGQGDVWFRQAWILTAPGEFLNFKMVAPLSKRPMAIRAWDSTIQSLQLSDPKVAIEQQRRNSKRAEKLLDSLDSETIATALPRQPQWYFIYLKGERIGWFRVQGGSFNRDGKEGFEIRTWAKYQKPKSPVQMIRQHMFTDPTLEVEMWQMDIQVGDGPQATILHEEGLRQNELIICSIDNPNGQKQFQKKVPIQVRGFYLPQMLGVMLPSFVDLKQPGAYTFAEYSSAENDFTMRTFTVIGPETIKHRGKAVNAIKAINQATADAPPTTYWLDKKGNAIRSETAAGIMLDSVSEDVVLKVYPKATGVVRALNKAVKGDDAVKEPKRKRSVEGRKFTY